MYDARGTNDENSLYTVDICESNSVSRNNEQMYCARSINANPACDDVCLRWNGLFKHRICVQIQLILPSSNTECVQNALR